MTTWTEVLDRFEAHLDQQQRLLADGAGAAMAAFAAPAGLGALPAGLEERARSLHRSAEALCATVDAELDATRRRLAQAQDAGAVDLDAPRFVDRAF